MAEPIIIDASALLSVLLEEGAPAAIRSAIEERELRAPAILFYEAANGVMKGRARFSHQRKAELLETIERLPIFDVPIQAWWREAVRISSTHDLTFYDAAYAAAAYSLQIPLLTLDGKLLAVMRAERIPAL